MTSVTGILLLRLVRAKKGIEIARVGIKDNRNATNNAIPPDRAVEVTLLELDELVDAEDDVDIKGSEI